MSQFLLPGTPTRRSWLVATGSRLAIWKLIRDRARGPKVAEPTGWKLILGPLISTAFAILQAVALGYFGFYLKDRVDAGLKERAQTVSSLQAMQAVLDKLKDSTQADERAENIVRLAMYGEDAIPVLINLAVARTRYDQNSMFDALNLLLVWHGESVCDGLKAALDKRDQFDPTRMDGLQAYRDAKCKTSKK